MTGTKIILLRRTYLGLALIIACFILLIFWVLLHSGCKIAPNTDPTVTELTINFLLPMERDDLGARISIIPEIPTAKFSYKTKWINQTTVVLKLKQEGLPYGQLLTLRINQAVTKLPFIKKSFKTKFRPRVPVTSLRETELHNISSKGPVPISFNCPVFPGDIEKFVEPPVPGRVQPVKFIFHEKSYVDHSRWQFVPFNSLKNNSSYELVINPGLRNKSGAKLKAVQKMTFITAPPISVLSTDPGNQNSETPLYKHIEVILDQDLLKGNMRISDQKTKKIITGSTEIKGKKIIFQPACSFLPGRKYRVVLNVTAKNNESLENYNFSFTTLKMDGKYWLDVKIGRTHTVTVYKGDKRIRHMLASGGRAETPTPLGFFHTQDRGSSFWSPRFGEGATFWVRLAGQILIHSVPRDDRWEIKKDEHKKLGLPASHGCIRLSEEDAKWVYQNIPRGTLVIIHP